MQKKENQRIALTKQLLQGALLCMLRSRPIHAISIRELCAEAGINRTTFYNHYGSQYDLLRDISQRYLDSIAQCLAAADVRSRESVQQRVALVLEYVEANLELSRLLLNNAVEGDFAERLFSMPQIDDMFNAALADCRSAQERSATVAFAIHGSFKLLQDWINAPERAAPAAEAELVLRMARRVCSGA